MSDFCVYSWLSGFFVVYVGLAFGWSTYRVYRSTHRNPFVLATGDDADGYVGRAFRMALLACVIVVVAPVFARDVAGYYGPLTWLSEVTRVPGAVLLVVSMIGVVLAQAQMGMSWRIGIDRRNRTALVQRGLFARSRNPIFLSMRVTLLGLFGVVPSAPTLALLVVADVLMQVQVRLEERHLSALHGEAYGDYCARVPRWL